MQSPSPLNGLFVLPSADTSTSLPPDRHPSRHRNGLICAVAAFTCWGLFPIYWRLLEHVPSTEVVCHRIVWSFFFLSAVLGVDRYRAARHWNSARSCKDDLTISGRKLLTTYSIAAVLISINWFVFIWAVNHDRVLEASLGYYINPLLSVMLGLLFLGERLSRLQAIAIAIAACGVTVMAMAGEGVPWISLALASSFALYGMVKKAAPLPAMAGLWIETTVLVLPAAAYLIFREASGIGAMGNGDAATIGLLWLGGCITVLPLALFATAAQRVSLSTLGMLQYVGPTLQFLVGIVLYGEPMNAGKTIGFVFVWIGSIAFLTAIGRRSIKERPSVSTRPIDPCPLPTQP